MCAPELRSTTWARQSTGDPSLRTRAAAKADAPTLTATGHTALPSEAEGRYRWGRAGGSQAYDEIELYFEEGKLQGYMTEHLDPDPHASPITFAFTTTHIDGHRLQWATRQVHGVTYSFSGRLERGAASSTSLAGYYLLIGTMTQHGGDTAGLTSAVTLKREPGGL